MVKVRPALLFWCVVLLAGLSLPLFVRETPELPELGEAPRIVMTDSTGAEFDSNDLRGKVWLVNFFFATCEGVCPAINGRIASLYREYQGDPLVRFVSITVDPEIDTPAKLAEYAKRFNAETSQWHFLNAPQEKVRDVLENGFRLISPEDKNLHTTRVVLIDRSGKIRSYYQGTQEEFTKQATAEIAALLQPR